MWRSCARPSIFQAYGRTTAKKRRSAAGIYRNTERGAKIWGTFISRLHYHALPLHANTDGWAPRKASLEYIVHTSRRSLRGDLTFPIAAIGPLRSLKLSRGLEPMHRGCVSGSRYLQRTDGISFFSVKKFTCSHGRGIQHSTRFETKLSESSQVVLVPRTTRRSHQCLWTLPCIT